MSVAVEVSPGGGLGSNGDAQPGGDRHVGEAAVALVAEQRRPSGRLPPSSQQQNVEIAIIVVVGVVAIQGPNLHIEPRSGGAILESAVATIDEKGAALGWVFCRGEDVGQPVPVEIVDNRPTRHVRTSHAQADSPGDVLQTADTPV